MSPRLKKYLIPLMLIVLVACESKPDGLLSKREMEDVLYDYHIAQCMASDLPFDERFRSHSFVEAVYEKHGITEAQFDSSLVYYNRHTTEIKNIYDRVKLRLEKYDNELQLQIGSNEMRANFSLGGDTADIWSGRRMFILRDNQYLNKESFVINADTTFYLNDQFRLIVDLDFIREDQSDNDNTLIACLAIHFKDGKTISSVKTSNFPSHFEINVSSTEKREIQNLSGFFFYQSKQTSMRSLGVVNNITLYRFHTTKIPQTEGNDSIRTTMELDSLVSDSLQVDSIVADSSAVDNSKRIHSPRLTPSQLREKSIDDRHDLDIRTAPEVRTPNSSGPRRRIRRR